jgi:hypothetical protein
VRLAHCRLGPLTYVYQQLASERQVNVPAIDIACLTLVNQEQVSTTGLTGEVDILAKLDEAACAEHGQPSIAQLSSPSGVNQASAQRTRLVGYARSVDADPDPPSAGGGQ